MQKYFCKTCNSNYFTSDTTAEFCDVCKSELIKVDCRLSDSKDIMRKLEKEINNTLKSVSN